METIIIIVVIVLLVIYFLAQDSKKETKKERYGEAVGHLAHSVADTVAGIAHDITEPSDKKTIRLAKEELASRNERLYRTFHYTEKDLERLLSIDDYFRKSLNALGLSEERWKKIGLHLYYVGCIKYNSRDHSDFTIKNSSYYRQHIMNKWGDDDLFKDDLEMLKKALSYFNIPEEDWIKYGDTVIEMYNINEKEDIREFGIITQILPMKNNLHLF